MAEDKEAPVSEPPDPPPNKDKTLGGEPTDIKSTGNGETGKGKSNG